MKPLVKKMLTVVLCASTLTAPLFLTGCSVSKVANSVQQGVQKTSQDDVKVFNNYIKAVGDFNSHTVRFGYAIGPDIQKLREGQHLTSFMSPHFDSLQKNLQAAKDAGVPYDDMKEPLDNVLAVLKDIVPVASELINLYISFLKSHITHSLRCSNNLSTDTITRNQYDILFAHITSPIYVMSLRHKSFNILLAIGILILLKTVKDKYVEPRCMR